MRRGIGCNDAMLNDALRRQGKSDGCLSWVCTWQYQSFDETRNRIGGRRGPFEAHTGHRHLKLQRGLIDEGLNAWEINAECKRGRGGIIRRAFTMSFPRGCPAVLKRASRREAFIVSNEETSASSMKLASG